MDIGATGNSVSHTYTHRCKCSSVDSSSRFLNIEYRATNVHGVGTLTHVDNVQTDQGVFDPSESTMISHGYFVGSGKLGCLGEILFCFLLYILHERRRARL